MRQFCGLGRLNQLLKVRRILRMYRVESLSQISLLSAFDLTVVLIGPPPCVPCIRPENEFLYYAVLSPIHAKDK